MVIHLNLVPFWLINFLTDTIEIDVDLISDGKEVYIAGILEHLEPAGVHSGDSTAVIPPFSINDEILREIEEKSKKACFRFKCNLKNF